MELVPTNFVHLGLQLLFFVSLIIFAVHACFVAYHWFVYGTSRSASLVAFAIYLSGGALFFITMSVSLNLL